MLRKAHLSIALLATVIFTGCGEVESSKENGSVLIQGSISGVAPGQTMLLELMDVQSTVVDSFRFDEGTAFHLSTSPSGPGYYKLSLDPRNFVVLILNDEDSVEVQANAANLQQSYTVKGSDESARLRTVNRYLSTIDSLQQVMQVAQQTKNMQAQIQASGYWQVKGPIAMAEWKRIINEKPGSLASLAALRGMNPEQDFELFKSVEKGLSAIVPQSAFYKNLKSTVDKLARLAPGAVAPEIQLNDIEGNPLPLSSARGKIVLLDFWASWCRPCRAENPNVVRLYRKYKDKGFEVYSVSLDVDKGKWTQAIAQDQLEWSSHVSDLAGWKTSVGPLYNISSIPQAYLLDEDGKIIAKNLRGKALEDKLAEIFGA